MITEKDIELIEKQLFGKLSDEEKNTFEQRIKSDIEFAREVNFIRDLKVSAKELKRGELKDKLKKIASEYKSSELKNKSRPRGYLAIAASVAVIIGIAVLFHRMQQKNKNDITETTEAEINQMIADSADKTRNFEITQIGKGYGYAETDSSFSNKLPVLIIHFGKYANHYLYRDTLFLFSPESDSLQFFSLSEEPDMLYFTADKLFYVIELKGDRKIYPVKTVEFP